MYASNCLRRTYFTGAGQLDNSTIAGIISGAIVAFIGGGATVIAVVKKQRIPDATALELKKIESHDVDVAGLRSDSVVMRVEMASMRAEMDKLRTDNFELQKSMIRQESDFNKKIALFEGSAKVKEERYERQIEVLTSELLIARTTVVRVQAEKDALQQELNISAAAGSHERRHGGPALPPRVQQVVVVNEEPIKVRANGDTKSDAKPDGDY